MDALPSRLTIEPTGHRILAASGVIDSHTADELASHLSGLGLDEDVRIDLTAIDFIDSSGLRVLINSHQELEGAGHQLQLSGISPPVKRLLEITGLQDHMHIV